MECKIPAMRVGSEKYVKPGTVTLYALTTFLGALLLFSAEPMIGKKVLPLFGGTPAVWNTCLVYFQLILLLGYAFSAAPGGDARREDRLVSAFLLIAVASMLALGCLAPPLTRSLGEIPPSDVTDPTLRLFWLLSISTALPLLMSAATAPLVQRWFAVTGHPKARDPYFLYAASNAGSLLGLLAYPFVIEPNLNLEVQARLWRIGFVVLAILQMSCGIVARRRSRWQRVSRLSESPPPNAAGVEIDSSPLTRPTFATRLRWLLLVFVPSSWLMGVTTYLTTDIA
jgi:hypothetical protein